LRRLEKDQKALSVKFFDESGWSSVVKVKDNTIHYQSAITFNAPPYKTKDLSEDVTVSLKVFVPFANEKEKSEFLKQQTAEENEDIDTETPDSSLQASADIYRGDPPDGKYESAQMDFKYTPCLVNSAQSRKKLDTSYFYEFIDPIDKQAKNKISEESRINLARRQMELHSFENSLTHLNAPNMLSSNCFSSYSLNPVSLNHSIKYAKDLNLLPNNLEEINLADEEQVGLMTDEQLALVIEKNFPKFNFQTDINSDCSELTIQSQPEKKSKVDREFFNFPSFSNDPNIDEANFEDLFN
jgi:hypothetical protein